jgi:two-component system sensor histidine kinase/response regulator
MGFESISQNPASLASASANWVGKHVLIVEDHPVNRQLTEAMMVRLGFVAELAGDGREAIALLERRKFDLVLMDIQMPEMDGLTATRLWRKQEKELGRAPIPIIAVTAHALPQDREACHDAGMNGYLSKPLRREALQLALSHHVQPTVPDSTIPTSESSVAARADSFAPSPPVPRENPSLAPHLVELLRVTNVEAIARVKSALERRDREAVEKAVHYLKGGCALLQDENLTSELMELNLAAKGSRLDIVSARLPDLEKLITKVLDSR